MLEAGPPEAIPPMPAPGEPESRNPNLTRFLEGMQGSKLRPVEYVAAPYWHPHAEVRQARFQAARAGTLLLVERGIPAFSPSIYRAGLRSERPDLSPPAGWYDFDLHLLTAAGGLTLLEVPGWEESRKILIELGFAQGRGMPISRLRWAELRERLDLKTAARLEPNNDRQWLSLAELARRIDHYNQPPRRLRGPDGMALEIGRWMDLLIELASWLSQQGQLTPACCPVFLDNGVQHRIHTGPPPPDTRHRKTTPLAPGLFLSHPNRRKLLVRHSIALLNRFDQDPAAFQVEFS